MKTQTESERLEALYRSLKKRLKEMRRVAVAFSGGVDSTFLLRIAAETLSPENVLAATAVSPILPHGEKESAMAIARRLGVDHVLMESHEMEDPCFTENPRDKCYRCKKGRFTAILDLAAARGFSYVLDGENVDDQSDFRPGSLAAREVGVRSVLSEVGLNKAQIRILSKRFGLPTWNKPASACLASRIPYHQPITPEKLAQIDRAEVFLRMLKISPLLRVRHHGDTARIEVPVRAMPKLLQKEIRTRVTDYFRSIGFSFVALDLEGYSMGSLNRGVDPEEKGSDGS